jgi:hypothetical protein
VSMAAAVLSRSTLVVKRSTSTLRRSPNIAPKMEHTRLALGIVVANSVGLPKHSQARPLLLRVPKKPRADTRAARPRAVKGAARSVASSAASSARR